MDKSEYEKFFLSNKDEQDRILSKFLSRLGVTKDSEDLIQETYFAVWKQAGKYKTVIIGGVHYITWKQKNEIIKSKPINLLCGVAKNLFFLQKRKRKFLFVSLNAKILSSLQNEYILTSQEDCYIQELETNERKTNELLNKALSILNDKEKYIFMMRVGNKDPVKFDQIANELGITASHARTIYVRAIDKLHDFVKRNIK